MIGRSRHRVDKGHGLLAAAGGRNGRRSIGVLLKVPLGERLVIPALARMEHTGCRRRIRLRALVISTVGRGGLTVIRFERPVRLHRNYERAIGISNNVHTGRSPGATNIGTGSRPDPYPRWPCAMCVGTGPWRRDRHFPVGKVGVRTLRAWASDGSLLMRTLGPEEW